MTDSEKKAIINERLDTSLDEAQWIQEDGGEIYEDNLPNIMFWTKAGEDIKPYIRQWAKDNEVRLFELDWQKLNSGFVNDYENGLLKELSVPRTVLFLENLNDYDPKKRNLVLNVYKDRVVGCSAQPVPKLLFAVATAQIDAPFELNMSENNCFAYIKLFD